MTSRYFGSFARAMARGERPVVFGDGLQSRDFTYVANVVRANLLALDAAEPLGGEAVNVGTGRRITLLDLVATINVSLGTDLEPELRPARVGEAPAGHLPERHSARGDDRPDRHRVALARQLGRELREHRAVDDAASGAVGHGGDPAGVGPPAQRVVADREQPSRVTDPILRHGRNLAFWPAATG